MRRPTSMDLSWSSSGACRTLPTEWFTIDDHEEPCPEAVAACGSCPVLSACRAHALAFEDHCYWGMMTAPQRRDTRRILNIRLADAPAAVRRGEVVALWNDNVPAPQIAERLGTNIRYVYRDLADAGIAVTDENDWRRTPRTPNPDDHVEAA